MQDTCAQCNNSDKLLRCSRCKTTSYCSKDCQKVHWKTHKKDCHLADGADPNGPKTHDRDGNDKPMSTDGPATSGGVWGVKILSSKGSAMHDHREMHERFQKMKMPPDHPIFLWGERCPFTALYGVPLLVYSYSVLSRSNAHVSGDNQPAVYLRIEPHDGFAPKHWQLLDPGDCYFIRLDRKPLSPELLETMYRYHSKLLSSEYFEDVLAGKRPVGNNITPRAFARFMDGYWKEDNTGRKKPSVA